jgi:hypothetical protein
VSHADRQLASMTSSGSAALRRIVFAMAFRIAAGLFHPGWTSSKSASNRNTLDAIERQEGATAGAKSSLHVTRACRLGNTSAARRGSVFWQI